MILLVVGGVTLLRLLLLWLTPLQLIADESHYWEWSRNLARSYYTKGPGIAWLIWGTTQLLGSSEGAIRTPTVVFAGLTALAVGRLAQHAAGGDLRAAAMGAMFTLLAPIQLLLGTVMTIDSPMFACWAAACLAGWWVVGPGAAPPAEQGRGRTWGAWIALALALGVGFLFKYTILLLPPGLLLIAWLDRRRLKWTRRDLGGLAACLGVFSLFTAPVWIWNAQHDWPTVTHLLGHLGAPGGDVAVTPWTFEPMRLFTYVIVSAVTAGPVAVLIVPWIGRAWSRRVDGWTRRSAAYLVAMAAPVLLLYLGVAFKTEVEANWPVAGHLSLFALAAAMMFRPAPGGPGESTETGMAEAGTTEPGTTEAARSPRLPASSGAGRAVAWTHGGVGVVAAAGLAGTLVAAAMLPAPPAGAALREPDGAVDTVRYHFQRFQRRVTGARRLADRVDALRRELRASTGREPIVVAKHYGVASLLAYYLPDQPVVFCDSAWLGSRRSFYDDHARTDLSRADLIGRPVVWYGRSPERVRGAFEVAEPVQVGVSPRLTVSPEFGGARFKRGEQPVDTK